MKPLFRPNRTTASATTRPLRYTVAVSVMLLILFLVIGIAQRHIFWGLLIGIGAGLVVGVFNYTAFRKGGWGARWYDRNRQ